jgi:hypothetical protein
MKLKSLLVYTALLTLFACGGGGSSGPSVVPTPGVPGSVTLSWIAPTMNFDGTALVDLSGYRIYEGTSSDPSALTPIVTLTNPGLSIYVLENLSSGRHYFAMTAVNSVASESDLSNVATVVIQ